ncbi:hypothetical protein Hamer_G002436 [Homarus americanus]|uniref:Uncharacterized protein n=1 Tax=Homarus americanus TaxID=6706 RepID=A0A8J5K2J4_HOMAM|nr:hypothetical protein Hamer_G002436 [Homarus americanus]
MREERAKGQRRAIPVHTHRSSIRFPTNELCLALQDRLEKVEKEVQSLKGENLALKLVLEEKKTFASVVKDGEVEVDSWKVVAASATKCTLKRHSAVDLNNRFSTLSDECEEGASNTTSATPSVSVERGSSADVSAGRSSAGLLEYVKHLLSDFNCGRKLVAETYDGVAVMAGQQNGLNKKLCIADNSAPGNDENDLGIENLFDSQDDSCDSDIGGRDVSEAKDSIYIHSPKSEADLSSGDNITIQKVPVTREKLIDDQQSDSELAELSFVEIPGGAWSITTSTNRCPASGWTTQ